MPANHVRGLRVGAGALLCAAMLATAGCVAEPQASDSSQTADLSGAAGEVALATPALTPVPGCTDTVYQGRDYRYCPFFVPWVEARDLCRSYGLDLVRIESAAENNFVNTFGTIFLPKWIGANDRGQEEVWAWSAGDVPFFQGSMSFGSPIGSAYEAFPPWEPVIDGGALDCANIRPFTGGAWFTTHCLEYSTFVCESADQCPGDPDKTEPGVCNCGFPDSDSDGDTVEDCIDECPDDQNKSERGVCDCGVSDIDSDGDFVPDCVDDDPQNPDVQQDGECGPIDSPAAPGTPCDDGACRGQFTCDGAGVCGNPADCLPSGNNAGNCYSVPYGDKLYTFCTGPATWTQAAGECRAEPGRHLAQVDSAAENAFIAFNLSADAWLGGNDSGAEGVWRWSTHTSDGGGRFWTGDQTGEAYFARYQRFIAGDPAGGTGQNCLVMRGSGADSRTRMDPISRS